MSEPNTPSKVLILILFCILLGKPDTFNSCNRYTSFGYGYRDFFEFHDSNFSSPNQIFYLEFYVKTSSDAHILLKSDLSVDDGYEIVIGGGSNTFSQIRLLEKEAKKTMITQKTENFLSGTDYKEFWISIDKLGIISVGKKEDDEVFINWRFDDPLPIKYFSFGSWTNMKADWRFGCKKKSDSDVIQEERNLSTLQKLKNDLFTFYNPNTLPLHPNRTLQVKVNFQIHNVQLDEKRGKLTMYGSGDLKWTDGKMKWKPENYDGIENIYVPPFQIWTPSIRILNALAEDRTPLFDLTAAGVMARYDGSIFWRPPFKSVSSCMVDLEYWPYDVHNCSVFFGFWMEPPNLVLTVMDEYETLLEDRIKSEWEILMAIPLNTNHQDDNENYGILYVELRRTQGPQTLVYTVPYFAVIIMSLTSFWVSPYSSFKLYLSCGSLAILLILLFFIGEAIPAMTENVPRIVKLYSWTAILNCIPIILFVILKNVQLWIKVPESVSKVLNNKVLGSVFCLPELPESMTEYANLNEDENKLCKDRLNSQRVIIIIERLCFIGYLLGISALAVLL